MLYHTTILSLNFYILVESEDESPPKLNFDDDFFIDSSPNTGNVIHIIIQHIDTLPKYGKKKLSMYVGPHGVYPTRDVNFCILTRECKK